MSFKHHHLKPTTIFMMVQSATPFVACPSCAICSHFSHLDNGALFLWLHQVSISILFSLSCTIFSPDSDEATFPFELLRNLMRVENVARKNIDNADLVPRSWKIVAIMTL
ncbi:hypothetical protein FRC20_010313 [Serendipita sp. 405]|nr:hypothetical protein FRC18_003226 [Serendipita sp. 400]KAG8864359.1 hypothetical protein FRC20_010313 [Serendipita sp. 405]